MKYQSLFIRLKQNQLFKDSFWAVFGNGLGYGLMLLAGILIARFLGKDLYGEYGMVKTTMFQIATFATFGLGYTSTRFVAEAKTGAPCAINDIAHSSFLITIISSSILALLLFVFARPLANFIEEPSLALAFRLLGVITIFKAILTTQDGVLAGLGYFKGLAIASVFSGLSLLVTCVPLTLFFSLKGSLASLAFSQLLNVILNHYLLRKSSLSWKHLYFKSVKKLLAFSVPVALQEFTYSGSSWLISLILVKMTTMGEFGLYSATSQWNTIIMFIPGLLSNVVLSHLSGSISNKKQHDKTMVTVIIVNLCCTVLPFIVVFFSANYIASFYGPSFASLPNVIRIAVFSTIITCVGEVLKSEMIAQGRNWLTFILRSSRDIIALITVYFLLDYTGGENGAIQVAYSNIISSSYFLLVLLIAYVFQKK